MHRNFSDSDLKELHRRGISVEEAERQLELLSGPEHHVTLERACTVGDGIVQLGEAEVAALHGRHAEAARAGRLLKFVPASGAASRMFAALTRDRREGTASAELLAFVERLPELALYEELAQRLRSAGAELERLVAAGDHGPILDALLGSDGMDCGARPKGLLGFHRSADGARTAFDEQMAEAAEYARDADGRSRLHLTVSPEARRGFEAAARPEGEFDISFSVQKRSTDTLALDADRAPLRDADGRLVFRPGGHGALIENLADLQGDVVFIKNIDNVQPQRTLPVTSHWKRALAGYLVGLQQEMFALLDRLAEAEPAAAAIDDAAAFARERLQWEGSAGDRAQLTALLNRPLRVCGVVRNTGEPGGGPFWVRDARGNVTKQIVEASQVDARSAGQQAILGRATHFNPVDLVCALRDHRGRPFDLTRFVDHEAVIVTRKLEAGREVRVLERPGLWNGAMAGWNTVFVEVPIETFTPVKTIGDLLRAEHLP
jgi:hypothetical protein